jgi:hypothetical protein
MPERPNISKGEGLVRTYDLLEHLVADVDKAFEILEADKTSPYLRRCVARTVFAFVEGVIQMGAALLERRLRHIMLPPAMRNWHSEMRGYA